MRKQVSKINFDNLRFVKAKFNYSILFFESGDKSIAKTLKVVESYVENLPFFRCHRSFIVNIKYVNQIDLENNIVSC